MKSALSLTVVSCLVISSLPVAAAQEQTLAAGPIHQAISRQALLLASAQQSQARDAEWSRVRNLVEGAEIVVGLRGAGPRKTYFVRADTSDLIVKATKRGPDERIARGEVVEHQDVIYRAP